jgi:hypothetical protein
MESVLETTGFHDNFGALQFHHRELKSLGSRYRVYSAPHQFTEVEAESAFEAMARSEIRKPFKISRYAIQHLSILSEDMLNHEDATMAAEEQADAVDAVGNTAEASLH